VFAVFSVVLVAAVEVPTDRLELKCDVAAWLEVESVVED